VKEHVIDVYSCRNCGAEGLDFLEKHPLIVPDGLSELEWDYIKSLSPVPKVLAISVRCGFVAVECLTPVEAQGIYVGI
jgi:hypothetical protein